MYLQRAEVQNFHGIRHLTVDLEKDTTVLIGENAWGKSSLLSALYMVLGQGHKNLCRFSPDDLYIPIRLSSDYEDSDTLPDPTASGSAGAADQPYSPENRIDQSSNAAHGSSDGGGQNDGSCHDDGQDTAHAHAHSHAQQGRDRLPPEAPESRHNVHGADKLAELGLEGVTPIKVINTPEYQRRYYSVPAPSGHGRILHIVDFPCEEPQTWTARCKKMKRDNSKGKKHAHESRSRHHGHADHGPCNDEAHSRSSSRERIARAQSTLAQCSELNREGLQCVQEDLNFFSSDVYKDKADSIVIDLFFCESKYGQLNSIERFECLKNVSWPGEDGRWRIHYRVSASFVTDAQTDESAEQPEFVTVHELLNENGRPYPDCQEQVRQLILLNPLLRLRDRRMYKPLESSSKHAQDQDDSFSMASGTSIINQDFDNETCQAISHFFASIATDEDLNSARMNDAVEVLNTIASKYLTSYQTSLGNQELNPVSARPRTAREIISHPVSIASLSAIKAAVADEKPSRPKLLLSLLAGALLMSKGQREIDEYSRPILILEDIESRFHPTLLLNLWSILQLLPVQKVVTTNSSQLLSAISLNSLRRLCKQYYDVRCYRIHEKAFSVDDDDERKIAFHIRMSRPDALFARCWILVEGETEIWLLNEMASVLGINLACNGIRLIEFAQCGLDPLMLLARQLGISFHVLTDGDDAGENYAAKVRKFVGSRNLSDHLSVMPHVDIEHYMYTSGFADVYQKAAGVTLRQILNTRAPDFISNINVSDLIDPQSLKEDLSPDNLHRTLSITKNESDSQDSAPDLSSPSDSDITPASASLHAQARTSAAEAKAEPALDAAAAAPASAETDAGASSGASAKAGADAPAPEGQEHEVEHDNAVARESTGPQDGMEQPELKRSDYTLKHHSLNTIIKTLLELNINDTSEILRTIVKKGKHRGRSSGTEVIDITEISVWDVSNLESYLTRQINKMPHNGDRMTASQTRMLNRSLNLCARLMKQARKNENMIQQKWYADCKKAQKQSKKQRSNNMAVHNRRSPEKMHTASSAARAQSHLPATEIPELKHSRRGRTVTRSLTLEEQLQALRNIKALAEKSLMHLGDKDRKHTFERECGRAANAMYGALDDQELSRLNMNSDKIIDQAIHKTGKPGLAILAGEAMQQRGADSVPLMFRTMFRRIKRMAQDEFGLN